MNTLTFLITTSSIIALASILLLHFTSPEFKPSWRMISEYALGKHKWLLTLFFISWGLSSVLSAVLLFNIVNGTAGIIGAVLIFISGIGAVFGGLFDVKHKLHGLAFLLGVPTLPVGALLITYHLFNAGKIVNYPFFLLLSAHSTWISLVLMAVSMGFIISGFKKAGIPMGPNIDPPESVPNGVIAVNGYANRLLVLCYILWLIILAQSL